MNSSFLDLQPIFRNPSSQVQGVTVRLSNYFMRIEVLPAVNINIMISWNVMPCSQLRDTRILEESLPPPSE